MIELSDGALRILKHLKDNEFPQMAFEVPAKIAALFSDVAACEQAEDELRDAGLVELGRDMHPASAHNVRAIALTREGVRYQI